MPAPAAVTRAARAIHDLADIVAQGNTLQAALAKSRRKGKNPSKIAATAVGTRMVKAVEKELGQAGYQSILAETIPDILRASKLKEHIEGESPTVSLRAIQWVDKVQGHGAQRIEVSKKSLHLSRSVFFEAGGPGVAETGISDTHRTLPQTGSQSQAITICPHCGKTLV